MNPADEAWGMIFDSYTRSVPFQCIFIVSFRLSLYLNFWISLCINAINHLEGLNILFNTQFHNPTLIP